MVLPLLLFGVGAPESSVAEMPIVPVVVADDGIAIYGTPLRLATSDLVASDSTSPSPPVETGDIVVSGHQKAPPGDPIQAVNLQTYQITQAVDGAITRPVAMGYKSVVPQPVRSGIYNALRNLTEPVVFINFMLQLKVGKAAETAARFATNSTIGVAGLFDMAKKRPFNLPFRANGFGDTLGYYGVGPGPFLFLPFTGPTTLRDLMAGMVDRLILPSAVGTPFNRLYYTAPTSALSALNRRVRNDERLAEARDNSGNPYATIREWYLARRKAEIEALHGRGVAPYPGDSIHAPGAAEQAPAPATPAPQTPR